MSGSLALDHVASGKVRELYDAGEAGCCSSPSDRISAFDVVLPTPIPDKGRVLTALSLFWFARTADIVPNHVITSASSDFRRGARDARPGRPLDARAPARDAAGRVRRARLPRRVGLEGLPAHRRRVRPRAAGGPARGRPAAEPIFTPSTKADRAATTRTSAPRQARRRSSASERFARLEQLVDRALRARPRDCALERGIIIADTKFEFGDRRATASSSSSTRC